METFARTPRPRESLNFTVQERIKEISEQPAVQRITELLELSKYSHDFDSNGDLVISHETLGRYTIEQIRDPEDPTVNQIFDLQIKTFGEDETDPIQILKDSIGGPSERNYHPSEEKQHVFAIKNESGQVVSVMMGGLLPIEEGNQDNTKSKRAFMISYAITDPDYRRKGLGYEAYAAALLHLSKEAQSTNAELAFAFGETEWESEHFWNSVGLRRVYAQKGDRVLDETKYYQPPIDFDTDTGYAVGNHAPLHLMIDPFTQHNSTSEISRPIQWTQDCVAMVDAANKWSSQWPISEFEQDANRPFGKKGSSPTPYQRHLRYSQSELKAFRRDIKAGSRVLLLSAKTREFFKMHGWTVLEHTAADSDNMDNETGNDENL